MSTLRYILPVLIAAFILGQSYYTSSDDPTLVLDAVQSGYHDDLDAYRKSLSTYKSKLDKTKTADDITALRDAHINARYAWKRIEHLLEYLDPSVAKLHINGAPLPKVEPKVSDINVIEPKGLQTLDEMVFADDVLDQKEDIQKLLKKLTASSEAAITHQKRLKLYHRHIWEAARLEIIRIATLGITGFDTPGSANAIPEALVALTATSHDIEQYAGLLSKKAPELTKEIEKTHQAAIEYLSAHDDFDTFDRMTMIRDYLNPLYALYYDAHMALGIETSAESSQLPSAINYDAKNIFAADFLDIDYFTNLAQDELSDKRRALGKTLFYDPILSSKVDLSCASCHNPDLAFTDGLARSVGTEGHTVLRSAPTLLNAVFAEKYFWDLREEAFTKQINHVVTNHQEFNTDFIKTMDRLAESTEYLALIDEAYPTYGLSQHAITDAISRYVASLTTTDSQLDQYMRYETNEYSDSAKRGFNLFMGSAACGTCHFAPTFAGLVPPLYQESESEVLGIPTTPDTLHPVLDTDLGRMVNDRPLDGVYIYSHSFKTVTARNAELTAPYMHNGVYSTLEELMDFYNRGGGIGLGLDVPNQTLPDTPLNLSDQDIQDIIAFLHTLTDSPKQTRPKSLPKFDNHPKWNERKVAP